MNNRLLFLLLLPLSLAAQPLQSKVNFRTGDLSTLKSQATREGKLLFVHFTAEWCMPCQWMEKNTFNDDRLAELINRNYLPVRIDIDDRAGLKSKQEYRVATLPSMLIFDTRSIVVARYEESMAAPRLYQLLSRQFREQTGRAPLEPDQPIAAEAPPRPASAISRPALIPERNTAAPPPAETRPPTPATTSRPNPAPTRTAPTAPAVASPTPTAPPRASNTPTAPPPAPATESPQPNFSVQVGVYSNYENAVRQKEQLEKQFTQPVNIFVSEQDGRQLYRILIGVFETRSAADGFVHQLKGQNISGFVKNMGEL